jgi:hypothetical protein
MTGIHNLGWELIGLLRLGQGKVVFWGGGWGGGVLKRARNGS